MILELEAADEYMATRFYTRAWDASSPERKQKALNEANEILNIFDYIGEKTVTTQPDEWPRSGIQDQDENETPQSILSAGYLYADALIRGFDREKELNSGGVTSRGISAVRTTYDPSRMPEHKRYGIPPNVWIYLLPYLKRDSSGVIAIHRVN